MLRMYDCFITFYKTVIFWIEGGGYPRFSCQWCHCACVCRSWEFKSHEITKLVTNTNVSSVIPCETKYYDMRRKHSSIVFTRTRSQLSCWIKLPYKINLKISPAARTATPKTTTNSFIFLARKMLDSNVQCRSVSNARPANYPEECEELKQNMYFVTAFETALNQ